MLKNYINKEENFMGQRLDIEIVKDGKVVGNCYYHWSAYTLSSLIETSKVIENYDELIKQNLPNEVLITKMFENCTSYDFLTGGFNYDLEYDAPVDSVEYFLFEGKTGTCSDFASAYVLLARAAGLTVRYVEGFVPTREVSATYEWQYVVRTKNAHAYPEVYIPNIGYVVYEPTTGIDFESERIQNNGTISYIMIVVIRVAAIFAAVIFAIAIILVISRIIAPALAEKRFLKKVLKDDNGKAVLLLYKRVREKDAAVYIMNSEACTPYEFALKFEEIFGYDISAFVYLVEKAAYQKQIVNEQDKNEAMSSYKTIKNHISNYSIRKNKR